MKKYSLIILCCFSLGVNAQEAETISLITDGNLKGWDIFLPSKGMNADPDSVFTVKKGILHVSGAEFGYIVTKDPYKDFHFSAEFKWGEAKHPPRVNEKRDSGILYFVPSGIPEKIWPQGVEYQIQEGDVGDFWLIDGATIMVDGERTQPSDYLRIAKTGDHERAHGEWNVVEIIAQDGKLVHVINGQIVNQGYDPNVKEGRILLQSEGAEIYYRKVEIKKL